VGGLGTRFLPATKALPKEMLTIVDKPIIQYAFEEARNSGIEKFIFITGRNKNVISNHFDHVFELQKVLEDKQKSEVLALTKDWLPPAGSIAFIRQQQPLGLGHAVLCARNFLPNDEPFAVLLADELFYNPAKPVLSQMIDIWNKKQSGNVIAVREVENHKTSSYGIIKPAGERFENSIKIASMVEKPNPSEAPSNFAIVGRYILSPEIFSYLDKTNADKNGEIQLTSALDAMARDNISSFGALVEGERFDCGARRGFVEANIAIALHNPEMREDILKLVKRYS
ncbi:MAG: UTP--glucose-1-phosphate uridylyltransferase, partial [Rickettsiales bacterium]|nr:UTP--glucose-1-phosphate uridylyltransferase [Rickettsiales bacterium]